MNLRLGFSPCPNDTFIFDAIVNRRIDTGDIEFTPVVADVEKLNTMSFQSLLDISKVSFHAFAYIAKNYALLDSGSALGFGNGPLVISKRKIIPDELVHCKIATPGKYTTADLLFGIAFPDAINRQEYLFSDIEQAVISGKADAGIIIHESRFTYEEKGLKKIMDLGEFWVEKTGLPIPLGCIAVKRSLPLNIQQQVNSLMKKSVQFAIENPGLSSGYVKKYANETEPDIISRHIELYVNDYTADLGIRGRNAIQKLFEVAAQQKIIPGLPENYFITLETAPKSQ